MTIFHRSFTFLALVFSIPVTGALTGCVGPVTNLYPPGADEPVREFYVVSHGWHTGIVIDRDDVPQQVWPEHSTFKQHQFIEIGWGDEAWYRSNKATCGLLLNAFIWPTDSVLHVVGFDQPVEKQFPDSGIIKVTASQRGFGKLMAYIRKSFEIDRNGKTIFLQKGPYGRSKFFKARGSYSGMRTCNRWTADAVRETGAPISTFYTATANNVVSQCRKFGRVIKER